MLMIIFLTLTLVAIPPDTGQGYREVAVYDGHVTLDVPADWNEIPQDVLEFYSLRAAETSGGRMTETYQHGFRPGDPEIDFALPQFLIQIRESGRLNYRQFLRLPDAEELRNAGERSLPQQVGPMVRGMELGDSIFLRDPFRLQLSNTLDLRLEGETSVQSVAYLTERGFFTIHFYAHVSNSEATNFIFEHVAKSVSFDDELRYKPRWLDYWPPRPVTLFVMAALIAAIAILTHLVRRRQQGS